MPNVDLTETHVRGVYLGSNGCVYAREDGVEERCSRCGRWARTLYRWSDHRVCGRHVRILTRSLIRLTTTFACRVYDGGNVGVPPGRVLRRGDTLAVAGRPERVGGFDKFTLADGRGHVLVPRSRWAWA